MRDCKCGNQVADNARACPKCGHQFTSAFTKFVAWIFGGAFCFIVLVIVIESRFDTPSSSAIPANPTTAAQTPATTSAPDAYSYESAIEFCKAEAIKRQPNAKGYVATGRWFPARPNQFHIQVDFGLGGPLALMTSDCRIARKNDRLTLSKINFTFAN